MAKDRNLWWIEIARGRALRLSSAAYASRPESIWRLCILTVLHRHCEALPVARLRGAVSRARESQKVLVSGTGNMVAIKRDRVELVPLSAFARDNLRASYMNWARLREEEALFRLVNYEFDFDQAAATASFSRLVPYPLEEMASAIGEVTRCFASSGHARKLPAWVIRQWTAAAQEFMSDRERRFWLRTISRLDREIWSIGPTHYDLTPANVMSGGAGPLLIDLARYKNDGLQFYDVVHFFVEQQAKSRSEPWTRTIVDPGNLEPVWERAIPWLPPDDASKSQDLLLAAYFLSRVALDGLAEHASSYWRRRILEASNALVRRGGLCGS